MNCRCGCGKPVNGVYLKNDTSKGWIKDQPKRYILGHVHRPQDPTKRHWREYFAIVEKALGHPLPKGAPVHHVNENPSDNRNSNLVICQSVSYHKLLHERARAYRATGHADWLRCFSCKQHGPDVEARSHGKVKGHPACFRARRKERAERERAAKKNPKLIKPEAEAA